MHDGTHCRAFKILDIFPTCPQKSPCLTEVAYINQKIWFSLIVPLTMAEPMKDLKEDLTI